MVGMSSRSGALKIMLGMLGFMTYKVWGRVWGRVCHMLGFMTYKVSVPGA
jgi:hypothetical protein